MSAAVAHEIRNPLAAISQANALLAEDITDLAQQRLVHMVAANAQRIRPHDRRRAGHCPGAAAKFSTAPRLAWRWTRSSAPSGASGKPKTVPSAKAAATWTAPAAWPLTASTCAASSSICWTTPSATPSPMQAGTNNCGWARAANAMAGPGCRSGAAGQKLKPACKTICLNRFFSSHSRSSGLGLFICRELCQRHGASLRYHRQACPGQPEGPAGNAFTLRFAHSSPAARGQTWRFVYCFGLTYAHCPCPHFGRGR